MGKKIYIVATDVPSFKGGAAVRNINLIKQYIRRGYEVRVFCLYDAITEPELAKLQAMKGLDVQAVPLPRQTPFGLASAILWHRTLPYVEQYRRSRLGAALKAACKEARPDIIQLEEITAYEAVASVLRTLTPRPMIILDAHNVEQDALAQAFRSFGLVRKLAGYYILPHMREVEKRAAQSADVVLACSDEDAAFFRPLAKQTVVVPNGVDCNSYAPWEDPRQETLIFTGGTSYPPNEEALQWYFSAIHPLVLARKPGVKIIILGGRPPRWLSDIARSDGSLILPGYVDDIRDYLKKASVGISPMISGSGTSLKILEYMASGRAVVSTTKGVRGIRCANGRDGLIADDPQAFADGIITLLDSPEQRHRLSQNARQLMERTYDWEVIGGALAGL